MSAATLAPTPLADGPSVRIRYMGNKHELAGTVAELVDEFPSDRPFLDLFCGMCSVGSAIAPSGRAVWGNDVQWSASTVARCLLTSASEPLGGGTLSTQLEHDYLRNLETLEVRFKSALKRETRLLAALDVDAFAEEDASWRHVGNSPTRLAEVRALAAKPEAPYRLFTLSFAWGYFGLRQAAQIDSIRYAIDRARARRALSADEARWALLALMQAASCTASTSGHFAQYLGAKTESGLARVAAQRRRDVWQHFLDDSDTVNPLGTADWRTGNRVMRRNALTIWPELRRREYSRGIVYADPPYSKDHYSRYYHVLDTLARYDYPLAVGKGRYRPDRFVTPFSLKKQVTQSFERLARGVACTHSVLILSYPSNGLLSFCEGGDVGAVLKRHFASVELAVRKATTHSTLGARHGAQRSEVDELIYVAQPSA